MRKTRPGRPPRPATRPAAVTAPAPRTDNAVGRQPAVVLAYAYSGATRIGQLLSGRADLACTSGTGLLPLCDQAAAVWQRAGDGGGPLSALAASTIRSLSDCMITVILAAAGKPRWCEISFSPPAVAETFLQLYPGTKFICLHRSCPDVIWAAVSANPWGFTDAGFGQFAAAYPGNTAAALGAYWAECTEQLLLFEQANPASCRRVTYEKLTTCPDQAAQEISEFLSLRQDFIPESVPGHGETEHAPDDRISRRTTRTPASLLPGPLTDRINELQARLGYPPIT